MFGLMEQFKHPTGRRGRIIAALMNKNHKSLTTWGVSHVIIEPEWVILDVGCGGGRTVNRLAKKAIKGKVFGLDYSPDMVNYSRKVNKKLIAQNRVEIIHGSVHDMSFPDNFFDLVTAIETYYFWKDFSASLREIKRVLKPNGILLCINEMVKDGTYEIKHKKIIKQTGVRLIPLEEIKQIFNSTGFSDVKIITKMGTPWNLLFAKK